MDEQSIILDGELSLETMAAILLPLEPLWDPLALFGPIHFDLSGATFTWPAAITLLTTTVLHLRQDGFEVRITRPASESVDGYLMKVRPFGFRKTRRVFLGTHLLGEEIRSVIAAFATFRALRDPALLAVEGNSNLATVRLRAAPA